MNRPIALMAVLMIVAGSFAIACSSGDSSGAAETDTTEATATLPTGVSTTGDQGWPRAEGLRGGRYCEVLLARVIEARLNAEVWNTYGLNECPQDDWAALDIDAIKAETQALAVILNGPRYWLMDAIERQPGAERRETTFGALRMFLGATVDLGPIPPDLNPYVERKVARRTVFEFAEGAEVYELIGPQERTFIMQSYSAQRDPSLTEDDLSALGSRLALPPGWSFRSRVLDATLRVGVSGEEATVVQDDLNNTYSLVEPE